MAGSGNMGLILKSMYFFLNALIRRRWIIAVELPMLGEMPYIIPILRKMTDSADFSVVLACRDYGNDVKMLDAFLPAGVLSRILVINSGFLDPLSSLIDLYVTSEQFSLGHPRIFSICVFHGQPSKGITFSCKILESFDMFFFLGPLHRQALEGFIQRNSVASRLPEIFEAGYPKLDPLINRKYDRQHVLRSLGLSGDRRTVLYAPAFNEFATLRTFGPDLVDALTGIDDINVIIKLAPDSINSVTNFYATGGINWREVLKKFEGERCRVADDIDINPYLEAADLMVTDVSGVAYDFLITGKPVVYFDCPDFYTKYLPRYDVGLTLEECLADDSVNAGRNYGTVVGNLAELRHVVTDCLSNNYGAYCPPAGMADALVYNPGTATDVSFDRIEKLLESGIPSKGAGTVYHLVTWVWNSLSKLLLTAARTAVDRFLPAFGYRLTRLGMGYIDARSTTKSAQRAGLSICDYLEAREQDGRKRGRRDRIMAKLSGLGVFQACCRVCEIGAGTGMYLEKVLEKCHPEEYEVYETDPGWSRYLREKYAATPGVSLRVHCADGLSLKDTTSRNCDLVHAHGVFVYLPLLQVLDYLREASRVCGSGGHVVFDCFLDSSFTTTVAGKWLASQWRFPVVIPEKLLLEFAATQSLRLVTSFQEVYGASTVDYLVFQKG